MNARFGYPLRRLLMVVAIGSLVRRPHRCLLRNWLIAILTVTVTAIAQGQEMRVEAVAGAPFGVGSILMPRGVESAGNPWADGRLDVSDAGRRLFYPVYVDGPIRQFIRDYAGVRGRVRIFFLFRGSEPFNVTLNTPDPITLNIRPRAANPNVYRRFLNLWWRAYTRAAVLRIRSSDNPPPIDAYLTSMLSRRLSLTPPQLGTPGLFSLRLEWDEGVEMLLGTESLALRTQVEGLLRAGGVGTDADRPLPREPDWPALDYPPVAEDVQIEPIAMHVPQDCFYLRGGTCIAMGSI